MKPLARIFFLGLVLAAARCSAAVENLRCEYLMDPFGMDAAHSRLSRVIASSRQGERQTAYQILVASSLKWLGQQRGDLWDSGKVETDDSSQIEYAGLPLVSREDCFWKVRIWDRDGVAGGWSQAARWQMGLLKPEDWSAQWIAPEMPAPAPSTPLVIRRAIYESTIPVTPPM
jgi:alpha-L-rhamnosidase